MSFGVELAVGGRSYNMQGHDVTLSRELDCHSSVTRLFWLGLVQKPIIEGLRSNMINIKFSLLLENFFI